MQNLPTVPAAPAVPVIILQPRPRQTPGALGRMALLGLLFGLLLGLLALRPATATTIDLMLVYDSTAASWVAGQGGANTFAVDVVSRMNQATQNSGLDLSFRLVHTMTASYTHSGNMGTDLERLQAGSSGLSSVLTARDTYGADLVVLLVDTGSEFGNTGIAYLLSNWTGSPGFGFSVNSVRSAAISHVVTHEVGHNLGAEHARNQTAPGPNMDLDGQYSAGWHFTGNDNVAYHTIMAYNVDNANIFYQQAPLFSTPQRLHQGTAAGTSTADNVRLIQQTKSIVAGYRAEVAQQAPARPTSITYPATSSTGQFTVSWPAVATATSYRLERSANAGSTWAAVYTGAQTQHAEVLTESGSYRYRVQAANTQGSSLWQTGASDIVVTLPTTPPPGTDDPVVIGNGASVTNLSGAAGSERVFTLVVPTGATDLRISTAGGTGDVDLYVRRGSLPTTTENDCKSDAPSNTETCPFNTPVAGTYYILLRGYQDYAGVTLSVSFSSAETPPVVPFAEQVNTLFIGYFGRGPTPAGVAYYASIMQASNGNYLILADDFWRSAESQVFYGGVSIPDQVTRVFINLFGREPLPAGQAYWTNMVESGQISLTAMAYTIAYNASPEDTAVLNAKRAVATAFIAALDTNTKVQAYAANLDRARSIFNHVRDTATRDEVLNNLNALIQEMLR